MFTKTLLPDTLRAIQLIANFPEIDKAYLAGGTALALQIGHRISVDLDFFTVHEFNEMELSSKLEKLSGYTKDRIAKWTILGKIGETKFSMFYYKYPLLSKTVKFKNINLASLGDIAAMKIHAIEQRGTRRDFVDVYFLSKQYTLDQMVAMYQKKYSIPSDRLYFAVRALDYFEDAEQEKQMPKMLVPLDWEEVKEYFRKETKRLAKEKLGI
jgi:predicted nucleotidyltransferase component of viral defense system